MATDAWVAGGRYPPPDLRRLFGSANQSPSSNDPFHNDVTLFNAVLFTYESLYNRPDGLVWYAYHPGMPNVFGSLTVAAELDDAFLERVRKTLESYKARARDVRTTAAMSMVLALVELGRLQRDERSVGSCADDYELVEHQNRMARLAVKTKYSLSPHLEPPRYLHLVIDAYAKRQEEHLARADKGITTRATASATLARLSHNASSPARTHTSSCS